MVQNHKKKNILALLNCTLTFPHATLTMMHTEILLDVNRTVVRSFLLKIKIVRHLKKLYMDTVKQEMSFQ
jgi:hypothetical protein